MTHLVLDAEATTDIAFGQRPEERSIEQRIAAGVLLLDKPAGLVVVGLHGCGCGEQSLSRNKGGLGPR